jgi:O-antigen/teichoic acid export membrane protein
MGLGLALTGATVVVLALGFGLRAIAVAELSLNVLYLAVSVTVARRLLPSWRFEMRLDPTWVRRLGRFGAFVVLNTFAGFIFLHMNRILVGRTLGPGAVPYLAVPWSLGARVTQVVNALTEAIVPVASELAAGRASDTLRALYSRSMRIATIAAMTIVVPLVVSAPELLALWLGPAFSERGATVLRILAVAAGIQSLGSVPYFLLNGIGRPAAANLPAIAGALANLLLTLALLRTHGLEGVAVAILSGVAVQTTILVLLLERALDLRFKAASPFLGPLLLAALAAAVSAPLAASLTDPVPRFLVGCTAAFVSFHGLLLATGSYGRREIDLAKEILFASRRSKGRNPVGPDV